MAGISPEELLKRKSGVKPVSTETAVSKPVEDKQGDDKKEQEAPGLFDDEEEEDDEDAFEFVEPSVVYGDDEDNDSEDEGADDITADNSDDYYSEEDEYEAIAAAAKRMKQRKVRPSMAKDKKTKQQKRENKPEQVRDLPSSVMDVIRKEFPQHLSKADAISAYVYVHSAGTELGSQIELSENAKEAVKAYSGDNTMSILDMRLEHIERMLTQYAEKIQTIELLTAYLSHDRTFGSKSDQVSPKRIVLRETGVLDVLEQGRKQAADQRAIDIIRNGRPRRRRPELDDNDEDDE